MALPGSWMHALGTLRPHPVVLAPWCTQWQCLSSPLVYPYLGCGSLTPDVWCGRSSHRFSHSRRVVPGP